MDAPNFDLALIYNTGGAFEKVASGAGEEVARPTLADYAVYVCYGDDVPDEIDLEKVAEVHEFLLDADRTGRAEAQMAFSELEDRYLQGDPEAAAQMQAFFSAEPEKVAHQDPLVAAARAELERRAADGLQKRAGVTGRLVDAAQSVSGHYAKRGASYKRRLAANLSAAAKSGEFTPENRAGKLSGAKLKAGAREFAPEIAAGGLGAAGLAGGGYLAGRGRNKKTTVVYR